LLFYIFEPSSRVNRYEHGLEYNVNTIPYLRKGNRQLDITSEMYVK